MGTNGREGLQRSAQARLSQFRRRSKPLKDPIRPETVKKVRAYRHGRIKQKLAEHDCAALLVYDPLNIRYATDCSDMQIWTMHNPSRYTVICTDGPTSASNMRRRCIWRRACRWSMRCVPASAGSISPAVPHLEASAKQWADEIADLVRQHGGGNMRLAVDKMEPLGVDLLRERGITIVEGQELTETARMIKSADELELMGWTIKVTRGRHVAHARELASGQVRERDLGRAAL